MIINVLFERVLYTPHQYLVHMGGGKVVSRARTHASLCTGTKGVTPRAHEHEPAHNYAPGKTWQL